MLSSLEDITVHKKVFFFYSPQNIPLILLFFLSVTCRFAVQVLRTVLPFCTPFCSRGSRGLGKILQDWV